MTKHLASAAACADAIIEYLGKDLRVGAQLAGGKPNHIMNALFRRAKADPSIQLCFLTALTLEKPKGRSDLEKRFIDPIAERVFGDYPDLDYEIARTQSGLPKNIRVIEFYFPAGRLLKNPQAQQDYISSNYTHAARDILDRGINVVLHQVAKRDDQYSLSCNADMTLDILDAFRVLKSRGTKVLSAVQVNDSLPFMFGDAVLDAQAFDLIVDNKNEYYKIFGPPKSSVTDADYMIGLYGSTLVKDGGELQIGIGALGDALTYSLLLRNSRNDEYVKILRELEIPAKFADAIELCGGLSPFGEGLFGASEMMVDGFLHLMNANILKRKVYDDLPLQRLINANQIGEKVDARTLEALLGAGVIAERLTENNFRYLKRWGILNDKVDFKDDHLVLPDGQKRAADLRDAETKAWVNAHCLGEHLKNGCVVHAGFFLGPQDFYEALRRLPEEQLRLINMRSVTKINQLYGHEDIDRLHRKDARFINTCLFMTLLGGAASETLEDGRVVSGIGGQYNFVSMAHALPGGRSILNLRSTRGSGKHLRSNLLWTYGNLSIPRHLRDIVVTEYGIAVLRAKTDSEVIAALLNIADSRFQDDLLAEAKKNQKISADYEIPRTFRNNFPESYAAKLKHFRRHEFFQRFPFGTDLTEVEQKLSVALKKLKNKTQSKADYLNVLAAVLVSKKNPKDYVPYLERMGLQNPKNLKEILYAKLIVEELAL